MMFVPTTQFAAPIHDSDAEIQPPTNRRANFVMGACVLGLILALATIAAIYLLG